MFAATKIFASNLNPRMAQRFFNLVLLDAVRADVHENKKLNYHYYTSLKKSLYKPAAFFKGVLLPLCKSHCTLREAAIVSSVLAKTSVPVAHSAVAIAKICVANSWSAAATAVAASPLSSSRMLGVVAFAPVLVAWSVIAVVVPGGCVVPGVVPGVGCVVPVGAVHVPRCRHARWLCWRDARWLCWLRRPCRRRPCALCGCAHVWSP